MTFASSQRVISENGVFFATGCATRCCRFASILRACCLQLALASANRSTRTHCCMRMSNKALMRPASEWGTAGVDHMRRQAQQFHVKSAGVGAFHLRLSRMGRQTSPIAQKTLFVPVSKAPVINALKGCPNISPPVREQRLLAFSASSQYYHRFNSESPAILVYNTLKQKRWQLLPQK